MYKCIISCLHVLQVSPHFLPILTGEILKQIKCAERVHTPFIHVVVTGLLPLPNQF